ncbi:polysaccharide biosynthesis tyrosine autokinase [Maritimibacter sp. HL-12]|uniref:GumC family protein n=1 Tax=Maritimibacter sp. HL-12 TaxID=1162418 RepID=UPI000A0F2E29|nr:polysaccharide biosynthesis tyrosine autokinase [Maritimibacter sp. HL-12]SMH54533.1 capsular exopolysaccharide family [Maritimibacter sp. HL-12]
MSDCVNQYSKAVAEAAASNRAVHQGIDGDEIDLLEVLGTLWRGKLWIVLAMLLAGATAWGYATRIAVPKYTAQAAVALDNRQGAMVDFENVLSGLSGDQATINTEVEVLRSRNLINRLVDDMGLLADPEFNPFLDADTPAPSPQHERNATVDSVAEAITVSNLRSSYVFTITTLTTDPNKSADIANRLAELYIADQLAVKFEAMETATEWLSERVATLRVELETAEARIKSFATRTDLVSVEALEGLNRQIKDTRVRLDGLVTTRDALATRVGALEAAEAGGEPAEMARVAEDAALTRLAGEIDGASNTGLFAARFATLLDRARADLGRAEGQVTSLGLSLDRLEADYARQSDDLVQLQQLERETQALRAIYEYFLTRMQETSVQRGIQQADSRILSYATQPVQPSEPRRSLILALGMILGLIAGAGVVLLREMMHTGFRTAESLEGETGLTVIGQLPKIPARQRKAVIDYLVNKPTSAAAEAVRNLRTSLMLSNLDRPPQVILSTSALSGEGKTTTAIALAQNFSGLGKKVLLIEGDIRRRVFSEYFDYEKAEGLLSILSGAARFDNVVQRIDDLGVDMLLGEQSTTNAADVFSSERFSTFMQDLRHKYDVIIIDTPPVLLVPDSRIIAQEADAVLFTVKWDATSRAQVREVVRQFALSGITITGAVLNQIDPKGMKRYGYGGQYSAYAAYGHNKYYNN